MLDIIQNKIEEIKKEQDEYLEMLVGGSLFSEKYITSRIHDTKVEINTLMELLEEING